MGGITASSCAELWGLDARAFHTRMDQLVREHLRLRSIRQPIGGLVLVTMRRRKWRPRLGYGSGRTDDIDWWLRLVADGLASGCPSASTHKRECTLA